MLLHTGVLFVVLQLKRGSLVKGLSVSTRMACRIVRSSESKVKITAWEERIVRWASIVQVVSHDKGESRYIGR